MGVAEILALLGLVAGLTSTGIGIGKGAASSVDAQKQKSYEEDAKRTAKKNKQLADKDARRRAIASAIGSRLNPLRKEPDAIDPYQPRDLSGFDVAAQTAGMIGQTASSIGQFAGANQNALDPVSAAGKTNPYSFDAVAPTIETDTTDVKSGDYAANNNLEPSRYGSYLTKRDKKYGTTSGQA